MIQPRRPALLALADDLSGAAEVAGALDLRGTRIELIDVDRPVRPGAGDPADSAAALVLDLDSRGRPVELARHLVTAALTGHRSGRLVFVKIDSLLRGAVGAVVAAVAAEGARVVMAPAAPHLGRTVSDGVVLVQGRPLADVPAWRLEPTPAPASIIEALQPLSAAVVSVGDLREGPAAAHQRLAAVLASGTVAVCDGTSEVDLDTVVAAADRLAADPAAPPVVLVGSGGLAAALGRSRAENLDLATEPAAGDVVAGAWDPKGAADRSTLVVVGTGEPSARVQVERLVAAGLSHHVVAAADLLAGSSDGRADLLAGPLADRLADGSCVLTVQVGDGIGRDAGPALSVSLAQVVSAALRRGHRPADLVLTGGATARRVLDAVGITTLRPVAQIEPGAVHSLTTDGRSVVTRPGSFGGPDSLVTIVAALAAHGAAAPPVLPSLPTDPSLPAVRKVPS